jgi:precorrin-8X/cobalt-precorrin-8 methylmutase
MAFEKLAPLEIERRSFEIISRELDARGAATRGLNFTPEVAAVVKRVIHTTADFDYAENLKFSQDAVSRGLGALRRGARIVTDTTMALSGISKTTLARLGGAVRCFIADEDVAAEARSEGVTRAEVSMRRAVKDGADIFAVGNAPTALIALHRLIAEGQIAPELVIAVPVGFVNVVEAKELFLGGATPHIVAVGRKGGSNVAAAIVNALMYQLVER